MEDLGNTVIEILRIMSEAHEEIQAYKMEMLRPVLIICSIPIIWLFWEIFTGWLDLKGKKQRRLRARGSYHKELPIDCIEVRAADISEEKRKNALSLTCVVKKEYTPNPNEAMSSVLANKKRRAELVADIIKNLTGEEICLLARSSGVYRKRDKGEIMPNEERERSFRLDVSHSWEKKKNDEWLWAQDWIMNNAGQVIGLRGISEETAAKGYDIYIPKASANELAAMSLTEMLKFCDAENCKLQIKENGSVFIFSETPGFKKKDVIKAMEEAAERQGIKVKIK